MTDGSEHESATGILIHQDIETLVRFYDQDKGFGFVQVTDGLPDAFLVRSTLAQDGYADVQAGDIIFCSIVTGPQDPEFSKFTMSIAIPLVVSRRCRRRPEEFRS